MIVNKRIKIMLLGLMCLSARGFEGDNGGNTDPTGGQATRGSDFLGCSGSLTQVSTDIGRQALADLTQTFANISTISDLVRSFESLSAQIDNPQMDVILRNVIRLLNQEQQNSSNNINNIDFTGLTPAQIIDAIVSRSSNEDLKQAVQVLRDQPVSSAVDAKQNVLISTLLNSVDLKDVVAAITSFAASKGDAKGNLPNIASLISGVGAIGAATTQTELVAAIDALADTQTGDAKAKLEALADQLEAVVGIGAATTQTELVAAIDALAATQTDPADLTNVATMVTNLIDPIKLTDLFDKITDKTSTIKAALQAWSNDKTDENWEAFKTALSAIIATAALDSSKYEHAIAQLKQAQNILDFQRAIAAMSQATDSTKSPALKAAFDNVVQLLAPYVRQYRGYMGVASLTPPTTPFVHTKADFTAQSIVYLKIDNSGVDAGSESDHTLQIDVASDGWTFANGQVKNANGDVLLTIAYANKYTLTGNDNNATDKMHITNRSTATLALTGKITGDVSAGGDVDVSGAGTITGDVSTGSVVQVSGAGTITGDVSAGGYVRVFGAGTISGDVSAGGYVRVFGAGTITGDVSTGSVVQVCGAGTITGDVSAGSYVQIYNDGNGAGTITGDVSAGGYVYVSGAGTITGDVSAGGGVQVYNDDNGAGTITGDISAKGAITTRDDGKIYGKQSQNLSDFRFTVDKMLATYQNNGTKYIATRSVLGLMMLCRADVLVDTDGISIIDVLKQMHIAVQNINGFVLNQGVTDLSTKAQAALAAITANNLLSKALQPYVGSGAIKTAISSLIPASIPTNATALKTLQADLTKAMYQLAYFVLSRSPITRVQEKAEAMKIEAERAHTARNGEVGNYTGANQYLVDIAYTYRNQQRDTAIILSGNAITNITITGPESATYISAHVPAAFFPDSFKIALASTALTQANFQTLATEAAKANFSIDPRLSNSLSSALSALATAIGAATKAP